jgi:hypothetical protein
MALRKDVKHPFPAESDEVTVTKDEPKADAKVADKDKTLRCRLATDSHGRGSVSALPSRGLSEPRE